MLSFDRGKPIARIEGGMHDGKVIKMYDEEAGKDEFPDIKLNKSDIFDILSEDYFRKNKKNIKLKELLHMKDSLIANIEPANQELKELYKKASGEIRKKLMKQFEIVDEGRFVPLPRNEEDQRDSLYVAGPSGSGKSTFCANYLKEFVKIFPKKKIFLFSRVAHDKPLDELKKLKRIMIDESLVDDPIDQEELADSICLFDDIDTVTNKAVKKAITELRTDILQTGRHFGNNNKDISKGIFCISTAHMLTNYKETRELLNESNKVVVFPKSGGKANIVYFLQKYGGMNLDEVAEVFKLTGRWVMLSKTYPMYILSEKKIYLTN